MGIMPIIKITIYSLVLEHRITTIYREKEQIEHLEQLKELGRPGGIQRKQKQASTVPEPYLGLAPGFTEAEEETLCTLVPHGQVCECCRGESGFAGLLVIEPRTLAVRTEMSANATEAAAAMVDVDDPTKVGLAAEAATPVTSTGAVIGHAG